MACLLAIHVRLIFLSFKIGHYQTILGLDYTEILLYLMLFHGITLSLRQLKNILKTKGLGRRRNRSDLREVIQAVEEELRGSGSSIGYRQMTQ